MAKRNNKNNNIDLRGKNNWITFKNTLSALIGYLMTGVFTGSTLATNGLEVTIQKTTPKKVGKAIERNAKLRGLSSVTTSFMSNKPTRLATNEIYAAKDKFFGDKESKYPFIDKANKKMTKTERKAFKLLVSALSLKNMNKKDINTLLELKGTKDGIVELANIASA